MKWIITDIDGCISPEESIPWDLEAFMDFARISRDASQGLGTVPPITLCTGRPQPYVEALLKVLHIWAPAICENGAVLYSLRDNRSRYGPGVTEEKILALRKVRAFLDAEVLPAEPDLVYQFGKESHLSVYSGRPELLPGVQARIERFLAETGGPNMIISPTHYYLNISMEGVDKGRTLRRLLEELGVQPHEVAGIGDTEGDLPLRDVVGFFACPGNAKLAVKEAADYVSPYADIRGVLDILRRPEVQRSS